MAIPAITSPNPGYEQIASGAAYSRTITASNTPTSYAASGLPAGLSINTSTGVITGSPTATAPTSTTVSVTATNGDGTSAAQAWLIVVLPSVIGLASGGYVVPIDLDLDTRRLSLPGIGSGQPTGTPPGGSGASDPLATWVEGDRFALSLGVKRGGVLQDQDLSHIYAYWRENLLEPSIALHEAAGDATETGSGTTARYEVPMMLNPDDLRGILSGAEKTRTARVSGYLQIVAATATDDRAYDYASAQESLGTFGESSSVVDSFTPVIPTEAAASILYRMTIDAIFPSAPTLNCQVVRDIALTYAGGTYVLGDVTGGTTDTGTPTVGGNWGITLTNSTLTASATGLVVGTTVAASAQKAEGWEIVLPLAKFTISGVPALTTGGDGLESYQFRNAGGTTLWTWTLVDLDTEADVSGDAEAAITGEGVAVYFDSATDTARFVFGAASAVVDARNADIDSTIARVANTDAAPAAPSYANAYVQVSIEGVEMPGLAESISSQIVALDIEASLV